MRSMRTSSVSTVCKSVVTPGRMDATSAEAATVFGGGWAVSFAKSLSVVVATGAAARLERELVRRPESFFLRSAIRRASARWKTATKSPRGISCRISS